MHGRSTRVCEFLIYNFCYLTLVPRHWRLKDRVVCAFITERDSNSSERLYHISPHYLINGTIFEKSYRT